MQRSFVLFCTIVPTTCLAQDLAINNARIIDGTGRVVERGSVLIRDGRVVAVETAEQQEGSRTIDARQMTVMPGLIDTHVHLITGPAPGSHGCDEVIEEIIAALTRNGAEFLGLNDELGTIEPGKVADIVIVDGDPLADASRLANVKVVIKAGAVVVDAR